MYLKHQGNLTLFKKHFKASTFSGIILNDFFYLKRLIFMIFLHKPQIVLGKFSVESLTIAPNPSIERLWNAFSLDMHTVSCFWHREENVFSDMRVRRSNKSSDFLDGVQSEAMWSGCAVYCVPLWSGVCKTLGLPLLGLALTPPLRSDTRVCFQRTLLWTAGATSWHFSQLNFYLGDPRSFEGIQVLCVCQEILPPHVASTPLKRSSAVFWECPWALGQIT